jgi:hypothetical protein
MMKTKQTSDFRLQTAALTLQMLVLNAEPYECNVDMEGKITDSYMPGAKSGVGSLRSEV